MQIGVPAETVSGETRVAATPETVKKLVAQGHAVKVQSQAGLALHFDGMALGDQLFDGFRGRRNPGLARDGFGGYAYLHEVAPVWGK